MEQTEKIRLIEYNKWMVLNRINPKYYMDDELAQMYLDSINCLESKPKALNAMKQGVNICPSCGEDFKIVFNSHKQENYCYSCDESWKI